jgi:LAS superfamily LD-carboxypeptidase LdcB
VRTHVRTVAEPACVLHEHVIAPFLNLRNAAAAEGFDLQAVSSFRDFERQLAIWNDKFNGVRPLLDADGRPLQALDLSPTERVAAILIWSALPGASRHHWGTDVDLIDAAATPPDYRVQLSAAEFAAEGPFGPLKGWLDRHSQHFGFFCPYRGVLSGVRPEPWHFSFAPVAEPARRALDVEVLRTVLADAPLLGKDAVLPQIEDLHARYVSAIDWP